MRISQQMLAFRRMFAESDSVTCSKCEKELKGYSLPRLAATGCPDCGTKQFTYNMSEEAAQKIQRVTGFKPDKESRVK